MIHEYTISQDVGETLLECLQFIIQFPYLLGGLLLLLLLLLGLSLLRFFCCSGSFLYWRRCLFLLLLFLDCHKHSDDILGLDHVVLINLELSKDIINLRLSESIAPGLEGVGEHLGVNLAISLVGLESLDNDIVGVIAVPRHLLLEHGDHVVGGAGPTDLTQQAVQLSLRHEDTNVVKGTAEVILVDHAVLVDVHQLEAVLVHLDLLLGETTSFTFILALAHADLCVSYSCRN